MLPAAMTARAWLGIPFCAIALAAAGAAFLEIEHDEPGMTALGIVADRPDRRHARHPTAVELGRCAALRGGRRPPRCYLTYASLQTFFGGLPIGAMLASVVLLILEILALRCRCRSPSRSATSSRGASAAASLRRCRDEPWVALQVPTYNEPVEVVRPTLESLAQDRLPPSDRPGRRQQHQRPRALETDRGTLRQAGQRFTFVHLEDWPGFKAGALNEATPRLPQEVEILGIVDADYQVHPQWLRNTIGYFDDRTVAFMQTSQHYRDWQDNRYLRGLFYSFRYFFDITMIARSHRNAIIFCGTMGLIRRSAFNEIGGWNQECITEDAEASLRMLGAGYRGVYDPVAYGEGLMPLDFDGLKKQRFRWALGGDPDPQVPLARAGAVRSPPDAAQRRAARPLPAR